MTDEIDRANDHAKTMLEAQIKQQRIAPPTIAAIWAARITNKLRRGVAVALEW